MFPETKRLSAEDASKVFDFDRKGRPLTKTVHVEEGGVSSRNEKEISESAMERENK